MPNLISVIENPWAWLSKLMEERRLRRVSTAYVFLIDDQLSNDVHFIAYLGVEEAGIHRCTRYLVASFQLAYCSPELGILASLS
jgi:hypothetical protein